MYKRQGYTFKDLIGNSKLFSDLIELAKKASESNSNVLITGESGTGKELLAHSIPVSYTHLDVYKRQMHTRIRLLEKLWNTISISISCQMTTGIIAFLYFGSFPTYFIITNILAIPLTGASLYLTAVTLITERIPYAGTFAASVLQFTVRLLNEIISIIANLG